MSFPSLFQHFAGRRTPRPNAPTPATEHRSFAPPEGMRGPIEPISGSTPTAFAPPEPSSSPTPVNVNAWGDELPTIVGDQRNVHPDSTTARGVPVVRGGSPPLRITPIDVRNHSGEQS